MVNSILILDVVKTDYKKEIDKKYATMMFPDTKSTLKGKRTMTQQQTFQKQI